MGYSTGDGKETTVDPSGGSGCTIEIASLAELEITGYCGISRPTADSDVITAIPQDYVRPAVVPLTFAKSLRNRKDGTNNLPLADAKETESAKWVSDMRTALKLREPT